MEISQGQQHNSVSSHSDIAWNSPRLFPVPRLACWCFLKITPHQINNMWIFRIHQEIMKNESPEQTPNIISRQSEKIKSSNKYVNHLFRVTLSPALDMDQRLGCPRKLVDG